MVDGNLGSDSRTSDGIGFVFENLSRICLQHNLFFVCGQYNYGVAVILIFNC